MAIGQLASTGKQAGQSPTPSTTKLYQVVIIPANLGSTYDFSFYSTNKIESKNDLYNKILNFSDYKINCNINGPTNQSWNLSGAYMKASGVDILVGFVKDGTINNGSITDSNPATYINKEV